MNKVGALALIVGFAGLALGACGVESSGDPGDPGVTAIPRIGLNSLLPAELSASGVTTDQLDATSAAAMGQSSDERAVLSYAIGCALDTSQSFTYSVAGTAYTDTGAMGVATAWTSRALTASEAAWVSACVLSRVNLTGAVVSISARGASAGYATTATELADYQIEEGAFWGNVFVDQGAIAGDSCDGVDQAVDDSYGDLPLRQCAQPDGPGASQSPCGMSYAGLCSTACTTATSPYSGCSFGGGAASAEVVTTFLSGTPE